MRYQACKDGKVVGEGATLDEALKDAENKGFKQSEVTFNHVRDGPNQ